MNSTDDIIDAEFVTIEGDSSPPPPKTPKSDTRQDSEVQLGIFQESPEYGTLRSEFAGGKPMSLPVFTAVAVICSVSAFVLSMGVTALVNHGPDTASPRVAAVAEMSGNALEISNVRLSHSSRDGRYVLTVRAGIANTAESDRIVPSLVVTFGEDGAAGRRYTISRGETLNAGEQMAFTSHIRVDDIPVSDPQIRFQR